MPLILSVSRILISRSREKSQKRNPRPAAYDKKRPEKRAGPCTSNLITLPLNHRRVIVMRARELSDIPRACNPERVYKRLQALLSERGEKKERERTLYSSNTRERRLSPDSVCFTGWRARERLFKFEIEICGRFVLFDLEGFCENYYRRFLGKKY